jgi:tetratricopeptide (TPR) repeat protein
MGLFSQIFGSVDEKAAATLSTTANDATVEITTRTNAAAKLLRTKHYDLARAGYASIAKDHPGEAGRAYEQIGASYHLQKELKSALQYYRQAAQYGCDSPTLQMNIDEVLIDIEKSS